MLGERSQAPEDSHWVTRSQEDGHSRGGAEEGGGERLVGAGLQWGGGGWSGRGGAEEGGGERLVGAGLQSSGMERSGGWTG